MFGLIDGNSFYCSCERAFDPKLRGVPLIVLSNNDGCAIARSREAKLAGVKMGDPWHLIKDKPGIKGVVDWRSSNYELYGDMSRRMYQVLEGGFPAVEPYSIDEMFLDMRGLNDLVGRSVAIRDEVRRVAKIPTCVGIGPTKTIAKLANGIAKDYHADTGVCDMSTPEQRAKLYRVTPLGEVWGMGGQSVKKLAKLGVETIADFVAMPAEEVRKNLTVTGMRTQAELQGRSCLQMAFAPPPKKMLAVTRNFGRTITDRVEMRQAVATYAETAGRRLRASGMVASAMQVFLMTNKFKPMWPQYNPQQTFAIEATADTMALIGAANRAMEHMWRDGFRYVKAGIILLDLHLPSAYPDSMFPTRDPKRSAVLMKMMDTLTDRHGRGAVRIASTAPEGGWSMRRQKLSPRYTTNADEMLEVRP
ncbi:MAG: Y-family DNA polymerase [Pseudomonadota bacterium]